MKKVTCQYGASRILLSLPQIDSQASQRRLIRRKRHHVWPSRHLLEQEASFRCTSRIRKRITRLLFRTKRTWKPNSQRRTYESEIMARSYTMNVTTAAMRWIDKAGGFDAYLLHTPDRKLASNFGSQLKRDMWTKIEEKGDGGVDVPKKARRVPRKPAWWSENEEKVRDSFKCWS